VARTIQTAPRVADFRLQRKAISAMFHRMSSHPPIAATRQGPATRFALALLGGLLLLLRLART
jgi:hypothetical protein